MSGGLCGHNLRFVGKKVLVSVLIVCEIRLFVWVLTDMCISFRVGLR